MSQAQFYLLTATPANEKIEGMSVDLNRVVLTKKSKSMVSTYWSLAEINSFGECITQEKKELRAFFEEKVLGEMNSISAEDNLPHRDIQRHLIQLYKSNSPLCQMAKGCLRCYISNMLKQNCLELERDYGTDQGLTSAELLPLVLDGKSVRHGAGTVQANKESLITEILQKFDQEQGSLSSWTKIMFRSNSQVKQVLLMYGILQYTDWMILCRHASSVKLQRVFTYLNRTKTETDQAIHLLASFHAIYRMSLLSTRSKGSKRRYPEPSIEQLTQIAKSLLPARTITAEKVLDELRNLASVIRKDLIQGGSSKLPEGRNVQELPPHTSVLLEGYQPQFEGCLAQSATQALQAKVDYLQRSKTEKARIRAENYVKAIHLFHCHGIALKEIASQLGFTDQPHLSHFLELKNLRKDIGRNALYCLLKCIVKRVQHRCNPDELKELESRVENLFVGEIDTVIEAATKEANIGHNRAMNSLLSRTICQVICTKFSN